MGAGNAVTEEERDMKNRRTGIIISIIVILIAAAAGSGFWWFRSTEPGWHEKNGQPAYYMTQERERAKGYQMIDGHPYMFDASGAPAPKGWVGEDGSSPGADLPETVFYCEGGGRLAEGWKYMDEKVWYFFQAGDKDTPGRTGQLARGYTTSGKIEIPERGYIGGEEGLALAYGIDVLNRFGWDLEAAYRYSSSLGFIPGASDHYGLTIHTCALQGFEKGEGNCLVWSGTFCVMARLLGKNCDLIWGTLQWNGTRPHAWTEIREDDGVHVYDPRKNDGKGLAGFDKRYGQKGTYKYNEDSKQYLQW